VEVKPLKQMHFSRHESLKFLASQSPLLSHTMVTAPMADISLRDRLKRKGVLGIMTYAFIIQGVSRL
jgi:hypothetical protein